MNRKLLGLLFALILILMTGSAFAQKPTKSESASTGWITESGFITGMGTGSTSEGQYQPILLIWHLASDLKRYIPALQNHQGTLSVTCDPQINPAFNPSTDVEFGVGFGLQYAYPITPKISPYVMGSVGPHYITLQNQHQANGFIFSDTVGLGLYYYLDKKSAINLGYRYRHISNAGLKSPNGGLDTQFGIIGYSVFF